MASVIRAFLVVLVAHAVPSSDAPPNPAVGQVLYVQGSGGNLRSAPSPDARRLLTLPIATRVKVRKGQGEWVEVQSGKRRGWMNVATLGTAKPDFEGVMKRFRETPREDLAGRRMWIERAAALKPGDTAVLRDMIAVLTECKDQEALTWAKNHLTWAEAWDGPLMVVENGKAMLHRECRSEPGAVLDVPDLPIHRDHVLFIGSDGVQKMRFGSAVCIAGPCGSDELGLSLDGVSANAVLIDDRKVRGEIEPLTGSDASLEECLKPKEAARWRKEGEGEGCNGDKVEGTISCRTFTASNGDTLMLRQLFTQNMTCWDQLLNSQWRWVKPERSEWFDANMGHTTTPVAVLVEPNGARAVIWTYHEGICCPSGSGAIMTRTSRDKKGKWTVQQGTDYQGGIGQPCD